MSDNDGVAIETMMPAGLVGTGFTGSADEVDRGPLPSDIVGRTPGSSIR